MNTFCRTLVIAALAAALFPILGTRSAFAQDEIEVIEIGDLSTTHILFTSDLTYVDISSPTMVAARVVEASKNMLAIKARQPFDFATTVSALEANGTMHTFYVRYAQSPSRLMVDTRVTGEFSSPGATMNTQVRPESGSSQQGVMVSEVANHIRQTSGKDSKDVTKNVPPRNNSSGVDVTSSQTSNFGRRNAPTIEEVVGLPRGLYHVTDRCYGLVAECVNVFAYSDLTYIVLTLSNNSDIGYEAGDAQFTVEDRKVSSRTLSTDKSIWPRSFFGSLSCPPGAKTTIGYTVPKLTLQKNEVLKVYIYEKGGNRNLFLTLDDKDINYANSPLK